ncbi:hypothetical protein TB2_011038 [Malus domestica]
MTSETVLVGFGTAAAASSSSNFAADAEGLVMMSMKRQEPCLVPGKIGKLIEMTETRDWFDVGSESKL